MKNNGKYVYAFNDEQFGNGYYFNDVEEAVDCAKLDPDQENYNDIEHCFVGKVQYITKEYLLSNATVFDKETLWDDLSCICEDVFDDFFEQLDEEKVVDIVADHLLKIEGLQKYSIITDIKKISFKSNTAD